MISRPLLLGLAAAFAAFLVWTQKRSMPETAHQNTSSSAEQAETEKSKEGHAEDPEGDAITGSDARPESTGSLDGTRRYRRKKHRNESEHVGKTNADKGRRLHEIFPVVDPDVCTFIIERFNGCLEESVLYVMAEYGAEEPQQLEAPFPSEKQEMATVHGEFHNDSAAAKLIDADAASISNGSDGCLVEQRSNHLSERGREELQAELSRLNALERVIARKKASLIEQECALDKLANRVNSLSLAFSGEAGKSAFPEGEIRDDKQEDVYPVTASITTALTPSLADVNATGLILGQEDLLSIPAGTSLAGDKDSNPHLHELRLNASDTTVINAGEVVTEALSPSFAATATCTEDVEGFARVDAVADAVNDLDDALTTSSESSWSDVANDAYEASATK